MNLSSILGSAAILSAVMVGSAPAATVNLSAKLTSVPTTALLEKYYLGYYGTPGSTTDYTDVFTSLPAIGSVGTATVTVDDADLDKPVPSIPYSGWGAKITTHLSLPGFLEATVYSPYLYYPISLSEYGYSQSTDGGSTYYGVTPAIGSIRSSYGINEIAFTFGTVLSSPPATGGELLAALSGDKVRGYFEADIGGFGAPLPFTFTLSAASAPSTVPLPASAWLLLAALAPLLPGKGRFGRVLREAAERVRRLSLRAVFA